MAVNSGSGRFLLRLIGVTGLFAAAAGAALWRLSPQGNELGAIGLYVLCGAIAIVGLVLLTELGGILKSLTSSRGAVGSSVILQIALALVLLGGANAYSHLNYKRFDWTWDRAFTLPDAVREQLAQLKGDTDIVIAQQNVAFGQRADAKQDRYDIAAQKKIVDKVRDLAELFQDLGPRFRVRVFDIQDDDYDTKLNALIEEEKEAAKKRGETPRSPLADAINDASENSIFFHADGKLQRLAFHDVYQVDKEASREANGKRGNLVLNFQGVEPIANKIFNIEEKKPRVAVAVVHPALSSTSRDHPMLTMNGAKVALEQQGFAVKDILLRKIESEGGLSQEAAAQSFDENRYTQIEEELTDLEEGISVGDKQLARITAALAAWKNESLAELNKTYVYIRLPNGQQGVIPRKALKEIENKKVPHEKIDVDEDDRKNETTLYSREVEILGRQLESARKERDALIVEKNGLNIDDLAEKRRIADVEAKMKRMLADTDLLVIPRFTIHHLPTEQIISNRVHKLDDSQMRAIRAFMKEGKPVLFMLGPVNEKRESPPDFGGGGGDDGLESMLAELGIRMPKQTIIYNVEAREFNERKIGLGFSRQELDLPAVKYNWPEGAGQAARNIVKDGKANPIRLSMHLTDLSMRTVPPKTETNQTIAKKQLKDLQIRHARPVYLLQSLDKDNGFDEAAVFLMTSEDSWNDSHPFLNEKREVPRYRPTPDDDPKKGTIEEVRRGPFPIAVAFERRLPTKWFEGTEKRTTARLAVIGNGGVFVGQSLNPMKEKLLLDVSNWLLGRDDLLARQNQTWSFPRVEISAVEKQSWIAAMVFGVPLLCVYFGIVVLLARRTR